VSGSSTFFDKTIVEVAGPGAKLDFNNVADTNNFKKFKLSTVYAEVPLELRFTPDPEKNGSSWKFAVGAKIGTMLNAHTKGKTLLTTSGSTLNAFARKESSKRFFNSTRLSGTARVGYGVFSVFSAIQINTYLKDGAGPAIRPYTIGIGISGL
ncbi:MAG: outer membrane beta-barrel protein, partial [Ferruginibacter sp.]|nr:outer membrane beta-barrel protein [Chitinophagaceae bacterium]